MVYKIIAVHGNLIQKSTFLSYIKIEETGGQWQQELIHHKTIEVGFSGTIQSILQTPIIEFNALNATVNAKLTESISEFITEFELEHKVDFIALEGLKIAEQLIISEPSVIAALLSLPVIAEFEKMNKALQGNDYYLQIAQDILNIDALADSQSRSIAIALLAVLRWRESNNILEKHTNATKNHIGGSLWLGVEA